MNPMPVALGHPEPETVTFDPDGSPRWSRETPVAELLRYLRRYSRRFISRARTLPLGSDGCYRLSSGSGPAILWHQCTTLASIARTIVEFAGQPDTIWRKTAPGVHVAGPIRALPAQKAFADLLGEVMFFCPLQADGTLLVKPANLDRLSMLADELELYENERLRACDGAGMPREYRDEVSSNPVAEDPRAVPNGTAVSVPPAPVATPSAPKQRRSGESAGVPREPHIKPVHIAILKRLRHCRAAQTRTQLLDYFRPTFGRDTIGVAVEHMDSWKFVHCPRGSTGGASIQDAGMKWLEEYERASGTPVARAKPARN